MMPFQIALTFISITAIDHSGLLIVVAVVTTDNKYLLYI